MATRRAFLKSAIAAAATAAEAGTTANPANVVIHPEPLFELSPYLYMQFMEPLGVTDSSVEAAWDYERDDWREDFVNTAKSLAPDVIRWGGLYSRHYRWREGVGPVRRRPPMRNYVWGGMETNRVGTHEFVDLCRRAGAEPLLCVNFLSDGFQQYWKTRAGEIRTGDAREAAEWVSYANDPGNAERKRNGARDPLRIKLWQLGNETSYGKGGFTRDEAIRRTIEFARAMKQRDRSIQLIGWGDRAGEGTELWAREMLARAAEHLDYVAIHMMGMRPRRRDTLLRGFRYQQDPEGAWEELAELTGIVENRVKEIEDVVGASGTRCGIAITEGHLSLSPHNANPILLEWLSAAYHARTMNIYERHGRSVRIAAGADFEGNRWTVNAVMLQVPRGVSYLTPVGSIMRLFNLHRGASAVAVKAWPAGLDIAASRSGDRIFLHVVNLRYSRSVEATFAVEGMQVVGGRIFQIAPENPRTAVSQDDPDVLAVQERPLASGPEVIWTFPPTAVAAVELHVAGAV